MNSITLQGMQPRKLLPLFLPLVFGIPFLLLCDLFPFHRFGMFARLPSKAPEAETRILLADRDSLHVLQTGSPCLDRGLISTMAAAAFPDPAASELLIKKLQTALRPFPDSVLLEQKNKQGWQRKKIFPSPF